MSATGKMESKGIKIINRDGDVIKFEPISDDIYKVVLPNELSVDITYGKSGETVAIDPSGGPYISVGSSINGMFIERIEYSYSEKSFVVKLKNKNWRL